MASWMNRVAAPAVKAAYAKRQAAPAQQSGMYYDEATGTYKLGINSMGVSTAINMPEYKAAALSPKTYAQVQTNKAQQQWETTYEPMWKEYGADVQRGLQTAYDRSLAEAQGRLGYGLSMTGSGEGGLAEASRLALQTEAQNKRFDIANKATEMMHQAEIQFMQTKDAQAFEVAKMAINYQMTKEMAEMNEPSWWESLGQIAGMGLAFLGNPFGGGGGGGVNYGQYQSGQILNSLAPSGAMYF